MAQNSKKTKRKQRPMLTMTIRMSAKAVKKLKDMAPLLGFSGYQPLIRYYVDMGLRADMTRLKVSPIQKLIESLKRHGVPDEIINRAIASMNLQGEDLEL